MLPTESYFDFDGADEDEPRRPIDSIDLLMTDDLRRRPWERPLLSKESSDVRLDKLSSLVISSLSVFAAASILRRSSASKLSCWVLLLLAGGDTAAEASLLPTSGVEEGDRFTFLRNDNFLL